MNIKPISCLILLGVSTFTFAEDSSQDLDVEHFQVKVKPNSAIPSGKVYSDHPSKIKYNKSRPEVLQYEVEVRGQCPNSTAKLTAFRLEMNNKTILNIPVSGNNRSLTGNHGNKWKAHTINVNFEKDYEPLINACVNSSNEKIQNQSHDQVLNSNFTTNSFYSGKRVQLYYHCEGGAKFNDVYYDTTALPLKALCEATGYKSKLQVTDSTLSINPITAQDGTCKANIKGGFSTNYELYTLRSNNSVAELKYRYKYQNPSSSTTTYSQWWQKMANPLNGGAFVFNYTDRLPTNISGGKVSLEVDIAGEVYSSKGTAFTIDCVDAMPLQQSQNLELKLTVTPDLSQTVAVNGQLCPSHANLFGELLAGYPINGKMIIYGSTLTDIHANPVSLTANQNANFNRRVKLTWPNAGNTLSIAGSAASTELKTQILNYGMKVTNSNNEVVKSIAKKPFSINCQHPGVNPNLIGSGTLQMQPDHTGGGGRPTALSGKSPFSRVKQDKVRESGLRSDGELVQAKKGSELLGHELSHTKNTSEKNNKTGKDLNFNAATNKRLDAHDRLANQQSSQQHSVPLEKATLSGIRSEQLNNTSRLKPTLYQGKANDRCTAQNFPKNTVIKTGSKQYIAECKLGKIKINHNKKVLRNWQYGDPVLSSGTLNKTPINKFRGGGLSDEMPEDFPAN